MPAEPSPTPDRRRNWKAAARKFGPWVVLVLALLFAIKKVVGLPPDPVRVDKLAHAMQMLPIGLFLSTTVVLLIANCAADSLAMYFTFGWFGCKLPYRELFVVRAATYLLAVVQYFVGQAAIVGFLYQRRNIEPLRAGGWILFISGINLGVLVLLAAVGLAIGDSQVWWLRLVPPAVAVGAALYALLLWRQPQGLVRTRMLAPLFEAGVVGHIKAVIVRLPHVMVLIVWHYLALHWFGVMVPFTAALVLLPAVFFAGALPVSPQGVGLTQVAALYFLSGYVQSPDPAVRDAAVFAYSGTMTVVSIIIQVLMGVIFLGPAKRLGMSDVRSMPAKVSDWTRRPMTGPRTTTALTYWRWEMASGPSRLNLGTLLVALVIGGAGYWVWKFFPHYFTAYQVDHVLAEGAAKAYRVSLLRGLDLSRGKAQLVDDMKRQVVALGVLDPDMALDAVFDGDRVNVECDYRAVVVHPFVGSFTVLKMHRKATESLKPPTYE